MSLYNEERPKRFLDVLGQEIAVRQMKRKIAEGRFPQTALLTGPRGTGKTTCARIIAKSLNCENLGKDGEPCCTCSSCLAVERGTSPAVIEMDAATRSGVDDVRSLISESAYVPAGNKKVFVLDEVHMFSTAAWNALLKTLEEPPRDAVFLLATTELQKVPATVLSRCVRFEFRTIPKGVIAAHLSKICRERGIRAREGAIDLIARSSEGCARDALSLLEQFLGFEEIDEETVRDCLGLSPDDAAYDLLDAIASGDGEAAISVICACEDRGRSLLLLVKATLEAVSGVLTAKTGGGAACARQEALAGSLSEGRLSQISGAFLTAYPLLSKNERLSFYLKAAILSLASSESLLTRLEREVEQLKKARPRTREAPEVKEETKGQGVPAVERKPEVDNVAANSDDELQEKTKVISFERPFDESGFLEGSEMVPGFDDYGGVTWEDLEDTPAKDRVEKGGMEESGLVKGLTPDDLLGMLGENDGRETGHEDDKNGEGAKTLAYEAESEDDPNAAFDFFMAGGSARRQ